MKYLFAFVLLLFAIHAKAQHTNVLISADNTPSEPSIAIDPSNTNRLAAGSVLDNYYYSDDGGSTWATSRIVSPQYGVWGDPTLLFDTAGNILYFHLANPPAGAWIDRIVCQKSSDNGQTWADSYTLVNGNKAQDKHWAVVDRTNNHVHIAWTQFDAYGSTTPGDSSIIWYARSEDGGSTWKPAIRINKTAGDCIDSDNTVEGAVPAVGTNGEVYVAWTGPLGLTFNRSMDGGETWMNQEMVLSDVPGGWDFAIPGIYRANGLAETVCDLSNGPHRGNVYVSWSDQRNGDDDTDVWLMKSTDGGNTWSERKRVNDDGPGTHQFFHWMTIDQVTGYLWWVWYDRRNTTDNYTEVYGAVSKDGGETFINFKISESPFLPRPDIFFGDYTNISAHDNVVRPIWVRLEGLNLSIWTALIDPDMVGIEPAGENAGIELDQNYPNPVTDQTCFSFKLHKPEPVSLYVNDVFGRQIACLIDNRIMPQLRNIVSFKPSDYNLKPGIYYFTMVSNEKMIQRKMIVAE